LHKKADTIADDQGFTGPKMARHAAGRSAAFDGACEHVSDEVDTTLSRPVDQFVMEAGRSKIFSSAEQHDVFELAGRSDSGCCGMARA
jgi:hypothetical protein